MSIGRINQKNSKNAMDDGEAMDQRPDEDMTIEQLTKEISGLKDRIKTQLDSMARIQADFDNYRKIKEREKAEFVEHANEGLLKKLVTHRDELARGIQMLKIATKEGDEMAEKLTNGFALVLTNLDKILSDEDVKPMNSKGKLFDPYKHEAVLVLEDDNLDENTVIDEIEKGYYYKKRVLRPARVIVSKKSN